MRRLAPAALDGDGAIGRLAPAALLLLLVVFGAPLAAEAQESFWQPSRDAKEYYDQTWLHPVALTTLAVISAMVLLLPRRDVAVPFFLLSCLVPYSQRVVIAGFDFNFVRLLVLVAAARIYWRGELRRLRWTPLDAAFLAWAVTNSVVPVLRVGTTSEVVYQLGRLYDGIGLYFVMRFLIRSWDDLARTARGVLLVAIPVAFFFAVEWTTTRNYFSVFGGVLPYSGTRDGVMRCQGPFVHPILGGAFWACVLPLLVARWWHPQASRLLVVAGASSAMLIMFAVGSSTPLAAVAATLVAACFYPLRFQLRFVRWGLVAGVLGLHLAMNAPVWHLISRVGMLSGSTGWHRFNLVDNFIRNFGEWWLLGTRSTAHWGYGLLDVTNEFVAQGVRGGLASLVCFLAMFVFAYAQVGRSIRAARRDRVQSAYAWALGLCVFAHMTVMMAVSYWAQILVPWYMTLAAAASLTPARARGRVRRGSRAPRSVRAPAPRAPALPGRAG